ncbi:MAG: homoserine O-succinyltransferase [Acidobacteriaceae bacterium]|nr:homoserine O-succinyltransferase [Acidobacteriaceae bacterium]
MDASVPCIQVALVNNMPDLALEDTELQFFELLDAASENVLVRLRLFSLPHIPRSELTQQRLRAVYYDRSDLWNSRFDAVIITGMEPRHSDLRQEPYWPAMTEVLDWAQENTLSAVLSCLAAHASVLHNDGVTRYPLPDKQFGVFELRKVSEHALTSRTEERLRFPHSRCNEVRAAALTWSGYSILTQSTDRSVDLFVKKMRKSFFAHFQGHPEYGTRTLLKEYRRDIRRFLKQERPTYPSIPQGYFDAASTKLLADFRRDALANRSVELMANFPEALVCGSLRNTWSLLATRIYSNWLQYVMSRKTETLALPVAAVTGHASASCLPLAK